MLHWVDRAVVVVGFVVFFLPFILAGIDGYRQGAQMKQPKPAASQPAPP